MTVPISIQYVGSQNTEKKVVIKVIYKAFFSKLYNFFNNQISINQIAIFIRIADIIGKGKYLKAPLNNNADIIKVNKAIRNQEVLCVAPELIFNDVLTNTAVFGIHPSNQVPILAKARPKTSLSLLNFTFVIFSAIFAEIIVSIIAIIVTTNDIVTSHFEISINWEKDVIDILLNGISNKLNLSSGYLSTSNKVCGKKPLLTNIHNHIQTIVKIITDGNFGKYFFQIIRKPNQNEKTINENIFVLARCFDISYKFIIISLCCSIWRAGLFNPNAQLICHKAIVTQTEIRNQWSAVDGINVIYFVIFKKYITNINIQENIAIKGKRKTQFSGFAKTNHIKIEVKAQATQKTL